MSERSTRTSPFADAGLGAGGRATLIGFALLGAGRALGLVVMAEAVARGIAALASGSTAWQGALLLGLGGAILRGILAWGTRVYAARSARATQGELRAGLALRLLSADAPPTEGVGSTAVLATRGLDGLDDYYRSVLPALTGAAVVPALVGLRILAADGISAMIVAVTILLVPLFLALIGMHTAERIAGAQEALARLSDHVVELARGLPVLVGLGRAEEQARALEDVSDDHRTKTLGTLRVAFLSGLALELVSTISVAVVAVFIGFRLVNGTVTLEIALVVLILAPECFAPFRDLGASFHASQDGLTALRRARRIIDAPATKPLATASGRGAGAGCGPRGLGVSGLEVSGLGVRYRDRDDDVLAALSFELTPGTIAVVRGPSGSGKSTLLGVLAGRISPGVDGATVVGAVTGIDPALVAWLPQHPRFTSDTVLGELALYEGDSESGRIRRGELLDVLGLTRVASEDPLQLSPGEARRVGVARALLRVDAGATLLLLDEPTAHLDEATARVVLRLVAELRGRVTVVIASHDEAVANLATRVISLGTSTLRGADDRVVAAETWSSTASVGLAGGNADAGLPQEPGVSPEPRESQEALLQPGTGRESGWATLLSLGRFLRPAAGRYLGASALGILSAVFGLALTAVSGWLIVKASTHPAVMYLLVAIVGVRFFGIGRSALRYAERLVTHDAVFVSVTGLRLRLWHAFTLRGATSRKLLGGSRVLGAVVGAADTVRDLTPRVFMPIVTALGASAGVAVTVGLLHAPALPLLMGCFALSLVAAPALTLLLDAHGTATRQRIDSMVLRHFSAMLGASPDLRANGIGPRVAEEAIELDHRAGRQWLRGIRALGLGGALVTTTCGATAVLMFAVSADAVRQGVLPPEAVAVLVLLPLGLVEPLLAALQAVQSWPALAVVLRATGSMLEEAQPDPTADRHDASRLEGRVVELDLLGVAATWPDAGAPAFSQAHGRAVPGRWLIVQGPSGAGKSTLLTVLLGSLRPSAGTVFLNGQDADGLTRESIREHVAWAPQDGHLFDSTLRANLTIARPRSDLPSDREMEETLARLGLGPMLTGMHDGLDTRVGSGGSRLSGGERQRIVVARALLSRASVVLLDEPTAHLDEDSARLLLADLRSALAVVVVVLVTHHASEGAADDDVLRLGQRDDRVTTSAWASVEAGGA